METLYDVLGVDPNADSGTIRRAYREGAKRHHPDAPDGDAERFRQLTTARDVLLDEGRRARYDRLGHRTYASRYLDSEAWPVDGHAEPFAERRRRPHRPTTPHQKRRARTERPPPRRKPVDGLVALRTYWPVVVRVGVALVVLFVFALVLAVL